MVKAISRQYKLGLDQGRPNSREEAVLDSAVRCESVLYDFSKDAGATGDVTFRRRLPKGALVTAVYSNELTALTSGGAATVQLKAGSTALTDALAFDTGFTGAGDSHALASSAEAIEITAASELKITIAAAALTAGKVRFYVTYLMPNDVEGDGQ